MMEVYFIVSTEFDYDFVIETSSGSFLLIPQQDKKENVARYYKPKKPLTRRDMEFISTLLHKFSVGRYYPYSLSYNKRLTRTIKIDISQEKINFILGGLRIIDLYGNVIER